LITHYQNEKEGAPIAVENLEQLVSAATLFVSEEGFGHDAPALMGPRSRTDEGLAPSLRRMAWKCWTLTHRCRP
jgi:DNA helicase-2/ATP-dependent DNA helicase PcrA